MHVSVFFVGLITLWCFCCRSSFAIAVICRSESCVSRVFCWVVCDVKEIQKNSFDCSLNGCDVPALFDNSFKGNAPSFGRSFVCCTLLPIDLQRTVVGWGGGEDVRITSCAWLTTVCLCQQSAPINNQETYL